MEGEKWYKIAWIITLIGLICGFLLMSEEVETYPTNEYWVAKNYRHVYEQYSGEIVNYIEEDETCKIKGDVIVVKRKNAGVVGYTLGGLLAFTAGCVGVALVLCVRHDNK